MICKKAMKIAMGVGMVLCATASFAAVSQQGFENVTDDAFVNLSGWTGDGTIQSDTLTAIGAGRLLSSSSKSLLVEGTVLCTNSTGNAGSEAQADFLINVAEQSDELSELEGDVKIAIAAGTNMTGVAEGEVPLCVYCKDSAGVVDWFDLATVRTDKWTRVTLAFDYVNGYCRVSINGEPVVTPNGVRSMANQTSPGAWYRLVSNATDDKVQSLSFEGVAQVDDVDIQESIDEAADFANSPAAELSNSETISYALLNKLGLSKDTLVESENWNMLVGDSGMTVGQKLECGLDPTTDTKFEPVSMTKTSATEATITFPCDDTSKTGRYKIVITGGTCNNETVVTGATTDGCEAGRAKITLTGLNQTAPVMTFKLVAEKPNN